jgi:hypothetical protein
VLIIGFWNGRERKDLTTKTGPRALRRRDIHLEVMIG